MALNKHSDKAEMQSGEFMNVGKSFHEIYSYLIANEEHPKFAKHTISGMVLWVFEELESTGQEVTPESIERVLKKEFGRFVLPSKKKKVS
jgi:hypothetical protein